MAKRFIVRSDIPKEPALKIEGQLIVSPGEYYGISLTEDKIKEQRFKQGHKEVCL